MHPNRTVILGEASEEESDAEEIILDKEQGIPRNEPIDDQKTSNAKANSGGLSGRLGLTLFSSIGQNSTLAKLANYSPYNLLASTVTQSPATADHSANSTTTPKNSADNRKNQLPPLHKTLYLKNQQLWACLNHLFKHPYEKAAKDVHSISQRLVIAQRGLQEIDGAITKLKREQNNMDISIDLIV